ncbi:hypothetical protein F53441_5921 [Fusarium austroafricanum]|uniref:Uncharacterized protein n=1 Tax=Fusarium austroafricanum TaxID=2364996 RepID=A0A8H4KH08_9HYPO|nr:hypothetical protein F53441_5921 [Fusarium austroafricanum]
MLLVFKAIETPWSDFPLNFTFSLSNSALCVALVVRVFQLQAIQLLKAPCKLASIGRVTASAASISNELTLAAAAFNIDFSLLKIEAPQEFNGLRNALSSRRIRDAEGGQHHITARQLGALFEAKVPAIPNLISKYGTRVSEICSGLDEQTQSHLDAGIFAGQTGPDGLNIWAGATSGTGGLAAHFLACLLARIWKPHEATSLWVEIVDRRKQEIVVASGAVEAAALMASQQIISRQQLAVWDASARAWLQTADRDRRNQHIQLNLIINNLRLPVSTSHDPYQSVMDTWISAMKGMELLVLGVSQRVNNGAILLAMSSWHLYSDLEVLLCETKSVHLKDSLMQSSVVTVSAQRSDSQKDGVFWSLPLSRMRFYSPPVTTERQFALDTNRVTTAEFCIAVLGGVTGPWYDDGYQRDDILESILLLENWLGPGSPPWLTMLSNASSLLLRAQGLELQQYCKLLGRGARRGRRFVNGNTKQFAPLFGLTSPSNLFDFLSEPSNGIKSPESKIRVLRKIVESSGIKPEDVIIRYKRLKWPTGSGREEEWIYEYASALPFHRETRKRTHSGTFNAVNAHRRWVPLLPDLEGDSYVLSQAVNCADVPCDCGGKLDFGWQCPCNQEGFGCSEFCHKEGSECNNFKPIHPLSCCGKCSDTCDDCMTNPQNIDIREFLVAPDLDFFQNGELGDIPRQECQKCQDLRLCAGWYNSQRKRQLEAQAEECFFILPDEADYSEDDGSFRMVRKPSTGLERFEFLLGIQETVAVFSKKHVSQSSSRGESCNTLTVVLEDKSVDKLRVLGYLDNLSHESRGVRSLVALAFAEKVYKGLNMATVSMEALMISLQDIRWPDWLSTTRPDGSEVEYIFRAPSADFDVFGGEAKAQLAVSFACVATFESGEFDIDPRALLGTFALSSGDSIYLTSAVTKDPTQALAKTQIRRILGNLGRPELAFLVTTGDPMLGGCDLASWQSVNHEYFDGDFHNAFTGTSLHLTLTDFELPIDVGVRGLRDTQVVILESVVSLCDRGKQLGDLNIIGCLDDPRLTIGCCCRRHGVDEEKAAPVDKKALLKKLEHVRSIDCWDEFFDFPLSKGIIRATGNWQGRIAAVAAGIQKGKKTLLLPQDPCLRCLQDLNMLAQFDLIIA